MAARGSELKLGFLTTIELPAGGYVGGLLVTNRYGHPLEFQCTTPVKANRTQEILYGPTLEPYLRGEVIGQTLVDKAAVTPDVVLTDDEVLLSVRKHINQPTGFVTSEGKLSLGKQKLRFHDAHAEDEKSIHSHAEQIPESADLLEPFERVREALKETVQTGAAR
ncbi:hypothetical protein [Calycomorphotria hydatis]|uniref:Uncharacterized protein n=1 Tax=Calycomorphotria hydatis TaxID=2528027 RepID=A0A517TDV9_9PLAN|nr:hypothetical protein [Calycomorphotria hydatis]QDT66561.1 hypothetical protein V22_38310 [Calycomorphotria hydatis]